MAAFCNPSIWEAEVGGYAMSLKTALLLLFGGHREPFSTLSLAHHFLNTIFTEWMGLGDKMGLCPPRPFCPKHRLLLSPFLWFYLPPAL